MFDPEKIFMGIVSAFLALIAWAFKSNRDEQNRRISVLEKNQQKIKEDAVTLERTLFEAFERINKEDEARHERDRIETKKDLQRMAEANQREHERIVDRLDTLINGRSGKT